MILPKSGEGEGAGTVKINIHTLQGTPQSLSVIKQPLFELKNKIPAVDLKKKKSLFHGGEINQ